MPKFSMRFAALRFSKESRIPLNAGSRCAGADYERSLLFGVMRCMTASENFPRRTAALECELPIAAPGRLQVLPPGEFIAIFLTVKVQKLMSGFLQSLNDRQVLRAVEHLGQQRHWHQHYPLALPAHVCRIAANTLTQKITGVAGRALHIH